MRQETRLPKWILKEFTPAQQALIKKHGTPDQFAMACYACVGEISFDEAKAAAQKYNDEFIEAGTPN